MLWAEMHNYLNHHITKCHLISDSLLRYNYHWCDPLIASDTQKLTNIYGSSTIRNSMTDW